MKPSVSDTYHFHKQHFDSLRKRTYTNTASHLYSDLTSKKHLTRKQLDWLADNHFLPSLHKVKRNDDKLHVPSIMHDEAILKMLIESRDTAPDEKKLAASMQGAKHARYV